MVDQSITDADCKKHRKRSGLRLLTVAAASAGALLLGGGVFAAWSPTAAMTSGSYDAANLAVTVVDANGTSFNTGVSNLLPGDFFFRYADLTNTGSVDQSFTGTISGTGALAPAMRVQVDKCSVSWASNGSCPGTTTNVTPETATTTPVALSFAALRPGSVDHVRFRYKLSDSAPQNVYQGTAGGMQVNLVGSSVVAGGQDRTVG